MNNIPVTILFIVFLLDGVAIGAFASLDDFERAGGNDVTSEVLAVGVRFMDDFSFVAMDIPLTRFNMPLYTKYLRTAFDYQWVWGISKFFVEPTFGLGAQLYPFGKTFGVHGTGHVGTYFLDNIAFMAEAGVSIEIPIGEDIDLFIGGEYFHRKSTKLIGFAGDGQRYSSSKGIAIRLGIRAPALSFIEYEFESQFFKAGNLYQSGKYSEAAAMYRLTLDTYEKTIKNNKDAWKKSKIFFEEFPTLVKYRIALCYAMWAEQGDIYTQAEDIVKEIYRTATIPQHREDITFLWGRILFKQGRYNEAHLRFQEVIDKFPQGLIVENALYSLGLTYLKLGDEESARKTFQRLLNDFPNSELKDDVQRLLSESIGKESQ